MPLNIVNIHKVVKNPNWQEADQLAIYKGQPGPPDYKSSAPTTRPHCLHLRVSSRNPVEAGKDYQQLPELTVYKHKSY